MAKNFPIERLKSLSESEKKQLEYEYNALYKEFEKITNELLRLMDKKEGIEKVLHQKMEDTLSINRIQQQLTYIQQLEISINQCRERFEQARQKVDHSKRLLTDKSIQVKKYEKLNDKYIRHWKDALKKKDMLKMDEAANLKFINH